MIVGADNRAEIASSKWKTSSAKKRQIENQGTRKNEQMTWALKLPPLKRIVAIKMKIVLHRFYRVYSNENIISIWIGNVKENPEN